MTRRRVAVAAILLAAATAFVVFAIVRPANDEDQAVGAAVEAIDGTTPNVGTWGSCDYEPGVSNAILRPRYGCVVRSCRRVLGRIEVTHDLLGGWSYEIKEGRSGHSRTGEADPNETTTVTELDPAEWTSGGNCSHGG
jgi:hypothetical protein